MENKNNKTEEGKGLFSGISGVLKKLAYKSEFVEVEEGENNESNIKNTEEQTVKPITQKNIAEQPFKPTTQQPVTVLPVSPGKEDVAAMNDIIFNYIKSINQAGIDFFEVWNAAEDMPGGANAGNLKTAFTILGYASPQKLSKDSIIDSANYYKDKISNMINEAVVEKQDERNRVITNKEAEKQSLLGEERALKSEIENLKNRLTQVQSSLGSIDTKYDSELNILDKRIAVGTIALRGVVGEIDQVIGIIKTLQI
jgi:hypothetical protein